MAVLVLKKLLTELPAKPQTNFCTFADERPQSGMSAWLQLHRQCFVTTKRPWTADEFGREFTRKPWWNPRHMWFTSAREVSLGCVCLKLSSSRTSVCRETKASVQWLMVSPTARRQGIARGLMQRLELAAWENGLREIHAETLSEWTDAVGFYRAMGFHEWNKRL